jgi:hypothetical protein
MRCRPRTLRALRPRRSYRGEVSTRRCRAPRPALLLPSDREIAGEGRLRGLAQPVPPPAPFALDEAQAIARRPPGATPEPAVLEHRPAVLADQIASIQLLPGSKGVARRLSPALCGRLRADPAAPSLRSRLDEADQATHRQHLVSAHGPGVASRCRRGRLPAPAPAAPARSPANRRAPP